MAFYNHHFSTTLDFAELERKANPVWPCVILCEDNAIDEIRDHAVCVSPVVMPNQLVLPFQFFPHITDNPRMDSLEPTNVTIAAEYLVRLIPSRRPHDMHFSDALRQPMNIVVFYHQIDVGISRITVELFGEVWPTCRLTYHDCPTSTNIAVDRL